METANPLDGVLGPAAGLFVVVLAASLAPTAAGSYEVPAVHVEVHENATACPGGTAPCLDYDDETWNRVAATYPVEFRFENDGSTPHGLAIATADNATPDTGTGPNASIATLDPIPAGQTDEVYVTVPAGTEALYLFCSVDDHEQAGERVRNDVLPASAIEDPTDSATPQWIPGPSPALLVALIAIAGRGLVTRPR